MYGPRLRICPRLVTNTITPCSHHLDEHLHSLGKNDWAKGGKGNQGTRNQTEPQQLGSKPIEHFEMDERAKAAEMVAMDSGTTSVLEIWKTDSSRRSRSRNSRRNEKTGVFGVHLMSQGIILGRNQKLQECILDKAQIQAVISEVRGKEKQRRMTINSESGSEGRRRVKEKKEEHLLKERRN